jgi:hypothetical protein
MKNMSHSFWRYIMVISAVVLMLPISSFGAGSGLGSPGNMLKFDGSNYADYTSSFDPPANFTIEGWFDVGALAGIALNRGFLVFDEAGAGDDYIALSALPSGAVQFTIADGVVSDVLTSPAATIGSNECNHLAIVVNKVLATITLYVNGIQVSQVNLVNVPDPVVLGIMTNNFIGGNFTHGYESLTDGSVDELRFWDVARTAAEIAANYNKDMLPPSPAVTPAALFDYYTFDVSHPQTTILDVGGAPANNLSLIGTPVPDLVASCADVYTDVPGPIALIFPANGAVDVIDDCTDCVDFIWDPATNMSTPDQYTLNVYAPGPTLIGTATVNHPTTTAQICGLLAGTTYTWNVTATNPVGTTISATFTFTTAPNDPDLILPLNGAIGQVTNPHLMWEDLEAGWPCDSIVYTVYVDDDPNFGSPQIFTTTSNVHYLSGLNFATTYYWKVEAAIYCPDPLNPITRCSEVFSFKTGITWNNAAVFAHDQIIWDLIECPEGSGILYAATWGGGIYRADPAVDPNYEYWVQVGHQGGIDVAFVWDLQCYEPFGPPGPHFLLASTNNGIYITADGGLSWALFDATGLPAGATDVRSLTIFNDGVDDILVAGTWGYGVFYYNLTTGPGPWMDGNNGLPANAAVQEVVNNGTYVYAGTADQGIFRVTFANLLNPVQTLFTQWVPLFNMPYRFIWSMETGGHDPAFDDHIFAGTFGDGFWRSTTSGQLWTQENFGLNNNYVHALFFSSDATPLAVPDPQLYAGTWPGGVYRADDYSLSTIIWEDLGLTQFIAKSNASRAGYAASSAAYEVNVSAIYANKDRIFVGTSNGRVYVSGAPTGPTSIDIGGKTPESVIPDRFTVEQNYPNPFNPTTTITFGLTEAAYVTIKVYDMLGREIKTLVNDVRNAGTFSVTWNGDNEFGQKVSSGTYIYKVAAGDNVITKKMVLIK